MTRTTPMRLRLSRRRFLAGTGLSFGGLLILPSVRLAHACQANERLRLAVFGNIATQFLGQTLCYDPATGQITNRAEANQKVVWKYRDGWKV